jgi:hypothetical protein
MAQLLNPVDIALWNGVPVAENPLTIPLLFDFTAAQSYSIDLEQLRQRGVLSSVQTVFLDNKGGDAPLILTASTTQQTVICPAQSQGYFAVLMAPPLRFTLSCTAGSSQTPVFLMNIEISGAVWKV